MVFIFNMKTTNITPRNEKGERHGYWEFYYVNGQLWCKGNYLNGKLHGYWEYYYTNGKLMYKIYYI